jgi:hypothetical protein
MIVFAGILSVYFTFLAGRAGRRLRFGLVLFACLAGGGLLLGLLMFPFAG